MTAEVRGSVKVDNLEPIATVCVSFCRQYCLQHFTQSSPCRFEIFCIQGSAQTNYQIKRYSGPRMVSEALSNQSLNNVSLCCSGKNPFTDRHAQARMPR